MTERKTTLWTDTNGDQWECLIRVKEAKRLHEAASIDVFDPEQLKAVVDNPLEIVTMLAVVHEEQRKSGDISVEDFTSLCCGSDGKTFRGAKAALAEALSVFFDSLDRHSLGTLLRKTMNSAKAAETMALARIQSGAVDQALEAAVQKAATELDKAIANANE